MNISNVEQKRLTRARRQRGFSILELTFVVAITLILTAITVPQMQTVIYDAKLRGVAVDMAGLIQQARIIAARQNTTVPVYVGSMGANNGYGAWIGTQPGTSWVASEPAIQFPAPIKMSNSTAAPSALSPGFTAEADGIVLCFNARGLPCKYVNGAGKTTTGIVLYLTDGRRGDKGWVAVSISPAARSRVWVCNGSRWR
jgi:Tfp pilus assembly protein FimT